MPSFRNFTPEFVPEQLGGYIPRADDGNRYYASQDQSAASFPPPIPSLSEVQSPARKSHGRRRPPGHIARPRNAFIIYRSHFVATAKATGTDKQTELSKMAGDSWRMMSLEQKAPFNAMADAEKALHARLHPGYMYSPNRSAVTKPKQANTKLSRPKTVNQTEEVSHHSPAPSSSSSMSSPSTAFNETDWFSAMGTNVDESFSDIYSMDINSSKMPPLGVTSIPFHQETALLMPGFQPHFSGDVTSYASLPTLPDLGYDMQPSDSSSDYYPTTYPGTWEDMMLQAPSDSQFLQYDFSPLDHPDSPLDVTIGPVTGTMYDEWAWSLNMS